MINLSEQTLEKQLTARIEALEAAIRDLKTPQAVGGDALPARESSQHTFTTTLAPGQTKFLTIGCNGVVLARFLSELRVGWFIDNDVDFNYVFPAGASLTSDQLNFDRSVTSDTLQSTETSDGTKTYVVSMKNTSTINSKTVYMYYSLIYQLQSGLFT